MFMMHWQSLPLDGTMSGLAGLTLMTTSTYTLLVLHQLELPVLYLLKINTSIITSTCILRDSR